MFLHPSCPDWSRGRRRLRGHPWQTSLRLEPLGRQGNHRTHRAQEVLHRSLLRMGVRAGTSRCMNKFHRSHRHILHHSASTQTCMFWGHIRTGSRRRASRLHSFRMGLHSHHRHRIFHCNRARNSPPRHDTRSNRTDDRWRDHNSTEGVPYLAHTRLCSPTPHSNRDQALRKHRHSPSHH